MAKRKIGLDPGHGGEDSGATGNGLNEKDINLAVALRVRDKLTAAGNDVFMTRTDDRWFGDINNGKPVNNDLTYRCDLLNAAGVELAVSIHCNSGGGKYIATYIQQMGGNAEALAGYIQRRMKAAAQWPEADDGGVLVKNLMMNRETDAPSCLVEMGFIDDWAESLFLGSETGQEILATAIAGGIMEYLGEVQPMAEEWKTISIAKLEQAGVLMPGAHAANDPVDVGLLAAIIVNLLKVINKY